jgi:hypothetical protein
MPYSINDWLADVSEGIPGCPKDIIDREVMNSIRDFCATTGTWQEKLDAINVTIGVAEYALVAPVALQASVVNVERAEFSGGFLTPDSMEVLDSSADAWRQQTSSGQITYLADIEKIFRFRYIPTESVAGGLEIWASLKPKLTATVIPDYIYDDWFDCIKYGVFGRIFKLPKQAWTNIREGEYFEDLFQADRSTAKKIKKTGRTRLSFRVQQPPFSNW